MRMTLRLVAALPLLAALCTPALSQEFSLDTTYASGNGQSGNMFDLRAESDIIITRLDAHIDTGSTTVEIYTTPGTYKGVQALSSAWTLIGSVPVSGMGDVSTGGTKTPIPLVLDIPMAAGETLGFYVTTTSTLINYTNGSSEGAVFATDGTVTFYEGIGLSYPFGGSFTPRVWNGTIHYTMAGAVPQEGFKELHTVAGAVNDAGHGSSGARLADRNGDGIDDYVLGTPGANLGRGGYTIHSGANGAVLQTVNGLINADALGASIANAGDTDGNGTEDLLVGAPGDPTDDVGFAYLYRNGVTFPSVILTGTAASGFGAAVAPMGDLDGDGRPDFAVGAPFQDTASSVDAGSFELVSGATGASLHYEEADLSNENLGTAIVGLGDLDGDGTPDYAVGSPGASEDPLLGDKHGRVTIYSGASHAELYELFGVETGSLFGVALASLGDVTGDGAEDLVVGAPLQDGGLGVAHAFDGASGSPLYTVTTTDPDARLGSCLVLAGDPDGDGLPELAVGAPSVETLWGQVVLVDAATGEPNGRMVQGNVSTYFGSAIVPIGDANGDPLDELVVTAPSEYKTGHPGAGVGRLVTTLGAPLVSGVQGVHSLDAGQAVVTGVNLVNVQAKVDGASVPSTYISPAELRIDLGPAPPGGFFDLELWTPEGTLNLPSGMPRYPALSATPTPALGDDIDIVLAGGDEGVFVLAYSPLSYGYPVPFTSFGWFHGLELNGVWSLAGGVFTAGNTTKELTIQAPTALSLIDVTFWLQAFTTHNSLGYAGFSAATPITLQAP